MFDRLTGGEKAIAILGTVFAGLIATLIMWLVWKDDEAKAKQAVKLSLITFAVVVVIYIILFFVSTCVLTGILATSSGY